MFGYLEGYGFNPSSFTDEVAEGLSSKKFDFFGWPVCIVFYVEGNYLYYSKDGRTEFYKRKLDKNGYAKILKSLVFNPFLREWGYRSDYNRDRYLSNKYGLTRSGYYGIAYNYCHIHADTFEKALKNDVPLLVKHLGSEYNEEAEQWLISDENSIKKGIVYRVLEIEALK